MRGERNAGMLEGWKSRRLENRTVRRFSTPTLHYSHTPALQSSSSQRGFSLLEVLVALAIFGIAAGGVLVALGHHLKNVSFLQDHARAVRIASREMNALRRTADADAGEMDAFEDRFFWTTQVRTDGLDDWPGLEDSAGTPARLSVTVQWSDSEGGPPLGKVHLDGFDIF